MLFRAKPDSPEGGLRPPAGDAPPPLFSLFLQEKTAAMTCCLEQHTSVFFVGVRMQLECMCVSSDEDGTLSSR